jgi:hypothetical protein
LAATEEELDLDSFALLELFAFLLELEDLSFEDSLLISSSSESFFDTLEEDSSATD